jgi:predicted RNA-binding Zn ribbon-like protein
MGRLRNPTKCLCIIVSHATVDVGAGVIAYLLVETQTNDLELAPTANFLALTVGHPAQFSAILTVSLFTDSKELPTMSHVFTNTMPDDVGQQHRLPEPLPTWEATRRFKISAAPAGLAFVQDFLNTRGDGEARDLLSTRDLANEWSQAASRAWSLQAGTRVPSPRFEANDLEMIRILRDRLADVLALKWLDPDKTLTGSVDLHLGVDGVCWTPSSTGWRELYSVVLCETLLAQRDSTWSRLKTCADKSCRVVFYDRTWDNRARLHDGRTCQ